MVSAQLVNIPLFLQNESQQKIRVNFKLNHRTNSKISSESSLIKFVSQLVLTIERRLGNPHQSAVAIAIGDR